MRDDATVTALRAELAAATAERAAVREESDERYKEAREIERRAQTYSDMAESLRGSYVEASAEVRRLAAELAAVTERAERAEAALAGASCTNQPCPVCGDGPSGEWSEGSEVDCDGCGTALYVDSVAECKGSSTFSLADAECPNCNGLGCVDDGDDESEEQAPDCEACGGEGLRTPTLAEAKAAAALAGRLP